MQRFRWGWAAVGGGLLWAVFGANARACDTPVYRYAMYNWPAAPFGLFWLHEGAAGQKDAAIERLREATKARDSDAEVAEMPNVEVIEINAGEKKQLDMLPEPVKKAWESREKKSHSLQVLLSPWGAVLFSGQLESAKIAAMLQSPLRKRLGKLLDEGNAAVFVVVSGKTRKRTRAAEKAVDEVIRQVRTGEITVESQDPGDAPEAQKPSPPAAVTKAVTKGEGTTEPSPPAALAEGEGRNAQRFKIAKITVDRHDAAEQWLLKPLLAIDEEASQTPDEALVFAVYGRGRALPPFVGEGISAENLTECVEFLGGACSCMVKDQNPGNDLLMTWDWDATSQRLAEAEEAAATGDRDEGTMGGKVAENAQAAEPKVLTVGEKVAAKDTKGEGEVASKPSPLTVASKPSPLTPLPTNLRSVPGEGTVVVALPKGAGGIGAEAPSFLHNQLRTYVVALAGAGVAVLLLGFFWMRRVAHKESVVS